MESQAEVGVNVDHVIAAQKVEHPRVQQPQVKLNVLQVVVDLVADQAAVVATVFPAKAWETVTQQDLIVLVQVLNLAAVLARDPSLNPSQRNPQCLWQCKMLHLNPNQLVNVLQAVAVLDQLAVVDMVFQVKAWVIAMQQVLTDLGQEARPRVDLLLNPNLLARHQHQENQAVVADLMMMIS
jgi:hypothetical protein